jgi:predicted amidohydrolase
MSRSIKIALIQFSSILGNIEKNIKKAIEMIEIATINGSKIICFPETFASGYDLNFFKEKMPSLAESLNGYTISSLRKIKLSIKEFILLRPLS